MLEHEKNMKRNEFHRWLAYTTGWKNNKKTDQESIDRHRKNITRFVSNKNNPLHQQTIPEIEYESIATGLVSDRVKYGGLRTRRRIWSGKKASLFARGKRKVSVGSVRRTHRSCGRRCVLRTAVPNPRQTGREWRFRVRVLFYRETRKRLSSSSSHWRPSRARRRSMMASPARH